MWPSQRYAGVTYSPSLGRSRTRGASTRRFLSGAVRAVEAEPLHITNPESDVARATWRRAGRASLWVAGIGWHLMGCPTRCGWRSRRSRGGPRCAWTRPSIPSCANSSGSSGGGGAAGRRDIRATMAGRGRRTQGAGAAHRSGRVDDMGRPARRIRPAAARAPGVGPDRMTNGPVRIPSLAQRAPALRRWAIARSWEFLGGDQEAALLTDDWMGARPLRLEEQLSSEYAHRFRTFFRVLDLAYLDRFPA